MYVQKLSVMFSVTIEPASTFYQLLPLEYSTETLTQYSYYVKILPDMRYLDL